MFMKARRKWGIAGILSLCCSCTANRAVIDPYAYALSSPLAQEVSSLADIKEDPSLDSHPLSLIEIIDLALCHNPATEKTWAQARSAAASFAQAQSHDFPTLAGNYQLTRSQEAVEQVSSNALTSESSTTWGPQLQLNYTVVDFGQTRSFIKVAKEALFSASCLHHYQIQTTLQKTFVNYYTYLSHQEQLKSKEADVNTASLTTAVVQKGVESGTQDASDLLQAKTTLLKAQIEVARQQQQVIEAKAHLLTTMGKGAHQSLEIAGCLDSIDEQIVQGEVTELIEMALARRHDLLATRADLRSQEAKIELAKRQLFPNITYDLAAFTGKMNPGGNMGLNYTSQLSFNIPLFSGFSQVNQTRKEASQRDEFLASLKQHELLVIEQVITSHGALQTAKQVLNLAKNLENAAIEQYEVILMRYQAGIGAILELITAQNTLAAARSERLDSLTSFLGAVIELSYVTGALAPLSEGGR
ncbi:MAG: TolC family protein [Candidatus Rhabdochlamydia sp.]